MITVGFGRGAEKIKMLLAERLQKEKIPFSYSNDPEKTGYALIDSEKNKKYDILVIHDGNAFSSAEFITLLNSDAENCTECGKNSMVISYGLNSLATVSASSINSGESTLSFQLCLQRSIASLKGKIIEPQEFHVVIKKDGTDLSEALAYSALCLVFSLGQK